jgi:hypothetical protein
MSEQFRINPTTDFVLERFIDAPRQLVWEALTKPEHLKEWWMPKPWGRVTRAAMDVRRRTRHRGGSRAPKLRSINSSRTRFPSDSRSGAFASRRHAPERNEPPAVRGFDYMVEDA